MKLPEKIASHMTGRRWVLFVLLLALVVGFLLPGMTGMIEYSRYASVPTAEELLERQGREQILRLVALAVFLIGSCLIWLPKRLVNPVRKEGKKQVAAFALVGITLCWICLWIILADVTYTEDGGAGYRTSVDCFLFGIPGSLLLGWLIPLGCFWFKFIRWKLAWGLMIAVYFGIGFGFWYAENRPEAIFHRRFGMYADSLQLEALASYNRYEGSRQVFCVSGEIDRFQMDLEAAYPRGKKVLLPSWQLESLPEFMRPKKLPSKAEGWECFQFVWTWKNADGKLYIHLNTWGPYHYETTWRAMVASVPNNRSALNLEFSGR